MSELTDPTSWVPEGFSPYGTAEEIEKRLRDELLTEEGRAMLEEADDE
jgi:hypothetical protein